VQNSCVVAVRQPADLGQRQTELRQRVPDEAARVVVAGRAAGAPEIEPGEAGLPQDRQDGLALASRQARAVEKARRLRRAGRGRR
jgi:hypothetical protein